jgi:hypothetical protein
VIAANGAFNYSTESADEAMEMLVDFLGKTSLCSSCLSFISTEHTVCTPPFGCLKKNSFDYCTVLFALMNFVRSSDQTLQAGLRSGCTLSYASQPCEEEGKLQHCFVHQVFSL